MISDHDRHARSLRLVELSKVEVIGESRRINAAPGKSGLVRGGSVDTRYGRISAVSLTFDEPPTIQEQDCGGCGRHYPLVKAFVARGDDAVAIAFTALHTHEGVHEAWIDAILGTFGDDRAGDHVTFGCRVGPFAGRDDPAASLVQAAQPYGDAPIWGQKLSRDQALSHPRLAEFWEVVDYVLVADPVVHHHVYRHSPTVE